MMQDTYTITTKDIEECSKVHPCPDLGEIVDFVKLKNPLATTFVFGEKAFGPDSAEQST